jgi:hypothetical protein
MLGEILKSIQIPDDVLARISHGLEHDQERMQKGSDAKLNKLSQALGVIRNRMSQAYADKLDGKIAEDFWWRQMSQWQAEEQHIKLSMDTFSQSPTDRTLNAKRTLELANVAGFSVCYRETSRTSREWLRGDPRSGKTRLMRLFYSSSGLNVRVRDPACVVYLVGVASAALFGNSSINDRVNKYSPHEVFES